MPAPGRSSLKSRAAWIGLFLASFGAGMASAAAARHRSSGTAGPPVSKPASLQPSPPAGPASAAAERIFQEGVQLLAADRLSEALARFEQASLLDRADPRPHHGAGKVYSQLFLHEKAEACYRRAIAADPGFRPSKESLAMLLHEKERHHEALDLLRELERETPQDPFVWGEIAINSLALGKTAEAAALLEKYKAAKPDDAWGHAHLGKAYANLGRSKEAEAEYRAALALDRGFQIAHYWLGQLLQAEKREAEAQPLLERYRKLRQLSTDEHQLKMGLLQDPDDLNALVGLSRNQLLLGKTQESRGALERAKQIAPEDPRVIELEKIHARGPKPR